jgi:hypothetical protein
MVMAYSTYGGKRMHVRFWGESLRERHHQVNLDVVGEKNIKMNIRNIRLGHMNWIDQA